MKLLGRCIELRDRFEDVIERYNKNAVVPVCLSYVNILYALHCLTQNRPVVSSSQVKRFCYFSQPNYSLIALHHMEEGGLVSHEQIGQTYYWSLTVIGRNTLNAIEYRMRHSKIKRDRKIAA